MEKKTLLVKEPGFYRLMLMLALPVIIQNMITVGVNIMDTVMLGSFGEIQLSGSSLANDFINLFQIACMGVGGGASVLSAQFYGKGDYNNVKKTVAIMLRVILSVAVVCCDRKGCNLSPVQHSFFCNDGHHNDPDLDSAVYS